MRGCFRTLLVIREVEHAFPAYAGMFPQDMVDLHGMVGFPRVCGDVSDNIDINELIDWLSPRMRGCFSSRIFESPDRRAFPAYAGMFLMGFPWAEAIGGFPRVCGDVSRSTIANNGNIRLSPRMRGCFFTNSARFSMSSAFPAYAGMFLLVLRLCVAVFGFPRVCGDVSNITRSIRSGNQLSPRMRGCFSQILSASSGV